MEEIIESCERGAGEGIEEGPPFKEIFEAMGLELRKANEIGGPSLEIRRLVAIVMNNLRGLRKILLKMLRGEVTTDIAASPARG